MLKLMKNVKGAALVEYGILVGLIAVLAIAAVLALGTEVRDTFNAINSALDSNLTAAGV
jgi:pilus assembly protein Flp/PilA